jgi:hypothetical protein
MPLQVDLLVAILEHGLATPAGSVSDPSENEVLSEAGVALVTAHVEQLVLHGLIGDAVPIFGSQGGMWIGYKLTDRGREVSQDRAAVMAAIAPMTGGPANEVSEAVVNLLAECRESGGVSQSYRADFERTLQEIGTCFDHGCFIASISLCGKILEICLKEVLLRNGVEPEPRAMMGNLIGYIEAHLPNEYLDRSVRNVVNLINTSRTTAIHAAHEIPIPSRDQAVMVIFAMRDVVRRHLAAGGRGAS